MKKIILPFDFSEVSINALKFALQLFKDDTIEIVHVSIGMFDKEASLAFKPIKTEEAMLKDEIKRMILNELSLEQFPPNLDMTILDGEIVKSIRNYVNMNDVDFVIMGTRDKYDLLDRWVGTVSLGLIKVLNVPVYLIPRHSEFNRFEKVLVASDFHLKENNFIDTIKEWNKDFKSYIKFMHIQQDENDDYGEESDLIVNRLFQSGDPAFGFEISRIKSLEVSDSLLATAYNYHADLLIVLPDNQDFISALLFRSITKDMVLKSNIPVLFMR